VRLWVDHGFSGDLRSENELALELTRRWSWRTTVAVDAAGAFFYRLGISAPGGAVWSLRIRDCVRQRDVLVDSDSLVTPKSWLLGSCELPNEDASPLPVELSALSVPAGRATVPASAPPREAEGARVIDLAHYRRR
jgi:hypothetical protein